MNLTKSKAHLNLGAYLFSAILSSITNLGVSVGVARSSSVVEFGAIASILIIYSVLVAISASSIGTLCAIRDRIRASDVENTSVIGAGLLLWAPLVPISLVATALLSGEFSRSLFIISLLLPALLLHDLLRYLFFAKSKPWNSVILDGFWLCGLLFSYFVLGSRGYELLEAWAVSASFAAVLGLIIWGLVPDFRNGLKLLITEKKALLQLGSDGVLSSLSSHITILLAGGIMGLAGLAAVRGAQVIVGPFAIAHRALLAALTPQVSARMLVSYKSARKISLAGSYAMCLLVVFVAFTLGDFPPILGVKILGETWSHSSPLIFPALLGMAVHFAISSPQTLLRCSEESRHVLIRVRLITSFCILLCCLLGAIIKGPMGFIVGLGIGRLLSLLIWERSVYIARHHVSKCY